MSDVKFVRIRGRIVPIKKKAGGEQSKTKYKTTTRATAAAGLAATTVGSVAGSIGIVQSALGLNRAVNSARISEALKRAGMASGAAEMKLKAQAGAKAMVKGNKLMGLGAVGYGVGNALLGVAGLSAAKQSDNKEFKERAKNVGMGRIVGATALVGLGALLVKGARVTAARDIARQFGVRFGRKAAKASASAKPVMAKMIGFKK
jgi:hypothetical protein